MSTLLVIESSNWLPPAEENGAADEYKKHPKKEKKKHKR